MTIRTIERRWQTTALMVAILLTTISFGRVVIADVALTDTDRTIPEFELPSFEGDTWTAATLEGQLTIVNFWATWCPPCIEEMPSMNVLWEKLEGEGEGVGMVAINAGEGEDAVAAFLEKIPVDFPILLGDGAKTLPNWSVRGLPTTLIVDGNGNVIYEALGPREWDDDAFVQKMLSLK